MNGFGIEGEMVRERAGRMLAEAEKRRLVRMAAPSKAPSLRARMARRLFEAAVATERDAAWNAVWEKMEAPRGGYGEWGGTRFARFGSRESGKTRDRSPRSSSSGGEASASKERIRCFVEWNIVDRGGMV